MRFWFKRDSSRARRHSRLWMIRLRRSALAAVALCALGGLAYAGWHSGVGARIAAWTAGKTIQISEMAGFRVNEILVTGRVRTPQEEILSRLEIRQGMPVFAVDVAAAQEQLRAIPWIESVQVARRLPGSIVVRIEERTPAALWQHKKKMSVIDAKGNVLTADALGDYADLPLVVGEGAQEVVRELQGFLAAEPVLAAELEAAVRVGQRRWDLRLKNGVTVRLPEENAELALRRLDALARQGGIFDKNVTVIDLRLDGRVVVDGPATPEEEKKKSA